MSIPIYIHYIEHFKCKYCGNTTDKLQVGTEIHHTIYSDFLKRNQVHCPVCGKPNYVKRKYDYSNTVTTKTYGLDDEYTLTEEEFNEKILEHLKNKVKTSIKNITEASDSVYTPRKRNKKLKELNAQLEEIENNPSQFVNTYIIKSSL